jgi:hypothetical protein
MTERTNGVYRVKAHSSLADGVMVLLFLAGAGILYVGFTEEPVMWGAVALGSACVVAGVLLLTVFKFKKLVAEVSEEGILERASKVSKGVIRWEEIESVSIYDCGMTNSLAHSRSFGRHYRETDKLVGIYLADPDAYAGKLNVIQKGIMNAALKMGFAPVSIPCNLLGDDAEALVEICNGWLVKKQADN